MLRGGQGGVAAEGGLLPREVVRHLPVHRLVVAAREEALHLSEHLLHGRRVLRQRAARVERGGVDAALAHLGDRLVGLVAQQCAQHLLPRWLGGIDRVGAHGRLLRG